MRKLKNLIFAFIILSCKLSYAQNNLNFNFSDQTLTEGKILALEGYEYKPSKWNGKVILMSHGSTGGDLSLIKKSYDFNNIAKEAIDNGYIFVTYMRKGRGKSEGEFTEETGRCNKANLDKEKREAELQTDQVIEQIKQKYGVSKVVLMGHSRGGFLSATYAGKNQEKILAVVNLAGAWTAVCETKNGGLGLLELEASAKKFKPQFWFYFDRDSYFAANKFNDPDYKNLNKIAGDNGVLFSRLSNYGVYEGHHTPLQKPWAWGGDLYPKLANIK